MKKFDQNLATLTRRDFLKIVKHEPHLTYGFTHSVICEVAYNMILFKQRRMHHARVAEYLEESQVNVPFALADNAIQNIVCLKHFYL